MKKDQKPCEIKNLARTSLLATANYAVMEQRADGSFAPGNNGPWKDQDTPVRVTAHYALVLHYALKISSKPSFESAMFKAVRWLIAAVQATPHGGIACRVLPAKDEVNGLIGQAWAIEALMTVGFEHNQSASQEAARALLYHPVYDFKQHGWCPRGVNGEVLNLCRTVNQQFWFAAMRSEWLRYSKEDLGKDPELSDFLKHISDWLKPGYQQLPQHTKPPVDSFIDKIRKLLSPLRSALSARKQRSIQIKPEPGRGELEIGYASFLLYGLCALDANHCFLEADELRQEVENFADAVARNLPSRVGEKDGFAWAYNPTGIEMAFVEQSLRATKHREDPMNASMKMWIEMQMEYHCDASSLMRKGTTDPVTLTARIYEVGRLIDL